MERQILTGLAAHSYEHSFDRAALASLKGTPGLELLIRKLNEFGIERLLRIQFTGSNLRVTRDSFPELYDLVREGAAVLNMTALPDLYIREGGSINAFTAGVERTILVLNAGAIDHLSTDELLFVIGHELGHIKSGHVLYRQIGATIPLLGDVVSPLVPGMGLISTALRMALLNWQRMSELTADRAGLLACQNRDAAISAMVKMAGLPRKFYGQFNVEDFIAQAREFKALDENPLDKVAKLASLMGQSHPWTVLRAAEFDTWIRSGEYSRLLGVYGSRDSDLDDAPRFCSSCGGLLIGDEIFCAICGDRIETRASSAY
jgi:Zn-dependent protease with chaperone function